MAALSRTLDAKRVVVRAKTQQSMVAAALRQAFIQPDRAQASQTLRHVAHLAAAPLLHPCDDELRDVKEAPSGQAKS